jgi:hypothetical protein
VEGVFRVTPGGAISVVVDTLGDRGGDRLSTPNLLAEAAVPPGGVCDGGPCWTPIPDKGFKYRDGANTADGLRKLLLKAGGSGEARVLANGRGDRLLVPSMPLPLPLRLQLHGPGGQCWESRYLPEGVLRNSTTSFVGKATAR